MRILVVLFFSIVSLSASASFMKNWEIFKAKGEWPVMGATCWIEGYNQTYENIVLEFLYFDEEDTFVIQSLDLELIFGVTEASLGTKEEKPWGDNGAYKSTFLSDEYSNVAEGEISKVEYSYHGDHNIAYTSKSSVGHWATISLKQGRTPNKLDSVSEDLFCVMK